MDSLLRSLGRIFECEFFCEGSNVALLRRGYRGFVEAGYSVGVGPQALNRVDISTTHGFQFNKYFFAGVGVGGELLHIGGNAPCGACIEQACIC